MSLFVSENHKKRSQHSPSGVWSQCPESLWSADFKDNVQHFQDSVKIFRPKEKQIRKARNAVKDQAETGTRKVQHQANRGERMAKLLDNGGVELNEYEVMGALWDAMDHGDSGNENLIRIGQIPKYVTNLLGVTGDFYIYRNHAYENMVSEKDAVAAGRPITRGRNKIHFHNLGIDVMTDAIMSVEKPLLTIKEANTKNPTISMILPVFGKNNAPLYAVLSFYSEQPVNGQYSTRPHILLTVSDRPYFGGKGRAGTVEVIQKAIDEKRVIDMVADKK